MQIFRGIHHPGLAPSCALTIGNFDGVHRGHQAMLALLHNEARQRGVPSCVMTFEPHPRDFFAGQLNKPEIAPARIAGLRDKLAELQACGIAQCVVLPFNQSLAALSPDDFVQQMLVQGLGVRYVLVGDDFCYGAKRAGDYASLSRSGLALGFEVARMNSYEISEPPSADKPGVTGVANFGVRPSLEANDVNGGRVLLETHCLDWPAHLGTEGGYGKLVRVELLHKLHDELKYESMDALNRGIQRDCDDARAWLAARI